MASHYPLTCCDRDCAGANRCRIGGYKCDDCGMYFCGNEVVHDDYGNTLCAECAEERKREEAEED